jgi:hypothetical protein
MHPLLLVHHPHKSVVQVERAHRQPATQHQCSATLRPGAKGRVPSKGGLLGGGAAALLSRMDAAIG